MCFIGVFPPPPIFDPILDCRCMDFSLEQDGWNDMYVQIFYLYRFYWHLDSIVSFPLFLYKYVEQAEAIEIFYEFSDKTFEMKVF